MMNKLTLNITEANETLETAKSLLTESDYLAVASYLVILGIIAILANSFVIFVLLKGEVSYYRIHKKLLLNIAIADLMLSLIAFPFFASSSFANRWLFSDIGCTFAGFWIFLLAQNDMNTHAAIAVYRYIIICQPSYEYYLKRKNASLYILGTVWGHTLLFTGLPLVGWSRYQQEAFGTSCTIAWDDNRPAELAYNIVIIIACYCVHVVIFIFCYYKIINEFSSAKRCLARLREEVITDRETLRLELMLKYHKVMTYRKVTVASLAMVAAFMIAWTPYAILGAYVMYDTNVPAWVLLTPTMFAKSSTVLSPLSCALFSGSFRTAAKQLFCKNEEVLDEVQNGSVLRPLASNHSSPEFVQKEVRVTLYKGELTINDIFVGNFDNMEL
ncbi:rhodopsin, G0-coupled-like [Mytilus galloprovincialis]|uniref:rhodopsin, G0-coupled-like n=1 Tax=Mytilus galloprovincialis TaxID=29158 RepID=UPI003F7B64E5